MKEKCYSVIVTRDCTESATIIVKATSKEEAGDLAIDMANDGEGIFTPNDNYCDKDSIYLGAGVEDDVEVLVLPSYSADDIGMRDNDFVDRIMNSGTIGTGTSYFEKSILEKLLKKIGVKPELTIIEEGAVLSTINDVPVKTVSFALPEIDATIKVNVEHVQGTRWKYTISEVDVQAGTFASSTVYNNTAINALEFRENVKLPDIVDECIFRSPYGYKEYNGQTCRIISEIPESESKDSETGKMYEVMLQNGEVIEALPEELVDSNGKHVFCRICHTNKCKECSLSGK